MRKKDVAEYFGNQTRIAEFIGKSHQLVSRWPDIIPPHWALYFDETTELEFDKRLYQNGKT